MMVEKSGDCQRTKIFCRDKHGKIEIIIDHGLQARVCCPERCNVSQVLVEFVCVALLHRDIGATGTMVSILELNAKLSTLLGSLHTPERLVQCKGREFGNSRWHTIGRDQAELE